MAKASPPPADEAAAPHLYVLALGANQRSRQGTGPRQTLRRIMRGAAADEIAWLHGSAIVDSAPVGPSQRRYANAVALVASPLPPLQLLARLQALEAEAGRRRRGRRWRARPLDLDILFWSGGPCRDAALTLPHPRIAERTFVVGPLRDVLQAAGWRRTLRAIGPVHRALIARRPLG